MKKIKIQVYPVISVFLLIIIWYIVARITNSEIILPSPLLTIKEIAKCFVEKNFYVSVVLTLFRVIISFISALVISSVLAILSYNSLVAEKMLYPLVVISRAIPTMSVILICLVWFNSNISPIIISFLVLFPLTYVNILSALKSADEKILETAKVYNVPRKILMKSYLFPSAISVIFDETVTELSFTLKLVIAGEALSQTANSIGNLMQLSKSYLDTGRLFAYTLITIILSFLIEITVKAVYKAVKRV